MLAADLGPYALAIVVVVAVVVVGFGRSVTLSWRDMKAQIGAASSKIDKTHDKVESIDRQVNQVGEDEPRLRHVVVAMHSQFAEFRADMALIKKATAEAALHSAQARKVAEQAADSTHRNNVLLTEHIAQHEADHDRHGD